MERLVEAEEREDEKQVRGRYGYLVDLRPPKEDGDHRREAHGDHCSAIGSEAQLREIPPPRLDEQKGAGNERTGAENEYSLGVVQVPPRCRVERPVERQGRGDAEIQVVPALVVAH